MSEPHVPGYCGGEEPKTVCSDHERVVSVEAAEVAAAVAEIDELGLCLGGWHPAEGTRWAVRRMFDSNPAPFGWHATIPAALAEGGGPK